MDIAEVNQQRWFEESGQWLEDVDGTHLVLANDQPVLQKRKMARQQSSHKLNVQDTVLSIRFEV